MNPSGMPKETPKMTAAERILAKAKEIASMPEHVVKNVSPIIEKSKDNVKFDVATFIIKFEEDAINYEFGHLGVGDYDKLLIEKVKNYTNYIPEKDKDIHQLVINSVRSYAAKITNRVGK